MALDVHSNEAAGDILVFLTGKISSDVIFTIVFRNSQIVYITLIKNNHIFNIPI